MTQPVTIDFRELDLDAIAGHAGRVAVFVAPDGRFDQAGRRINRLTRGALARLAASPAFERLEEGEACLIDWPTGMAAEAVIVVKLARRPDAATARRAGGRLAARRAGKPLLVLAGSRMRMDELVEGLALRAYAFVEYKSDEKAREGLDAPVTVMTTKPEALAATALERGAEVEGVFFARDLVNEPSNVLSTEDFAARLAAMGEETELEVEILDEKRLEELGMHALLAVGQGSCRPSKVVTMRWNGGAEETAPLALVGKGVVFDSGGISIKPAQGMEEMTMDMGGAAVVAGVMRTLALRKARANVVGVVGLVENMPDGCAQRPGDIVRTMKGDTVEVINTDAEGRLVLADALWYAQETFKPAAVIDFATLTGAIIIALGHDRAGVFAEDDDFVGAFLEAAGQVGEGAWRMPLDAAYDRQLKSRLADVKNVGGRPAGAVTAARFLRRFVKDDMPWIHVDIAGVALLKEDTDLAPKGATGWGVRTVNRLIRERFEAAEG